MRRGLGVSSDLQQLARSSVGIGIILAATGLLTWVSLSIWGGIAGPDEGFRLREAWDTPSYFYVGVPIMALAVAAAAFLRPTRPWRWPLWLVGGHQLGVMLVGVGMQSGLSLAILTVILGILLAVLFGVPAMLGVMAARALAERAF